MSALGITLNCIWWWDSSAGALESALSLPLLPGPLWPRVIAPVGIPSMDQIELFNHLLYL